MGNANIEIGQAIRQHRKRLGLTLEEMQKRTGINNGNLSKIERGMQSLTNDSMQSIANAFGIPLSDLFSAQRAQGGFSVQNGVSKPASHRSVSEFQSLDQIPQDENVAIGTITASLDAARGGVKIGIDDKMSHLFMGSELTGITAHPAALGTRAIEDDTMEPRLFKGDVVVVDMQSTEVPQTGGVFCVMLDDENFAFRRLMPYPGKGLRVICDNSKYPEAVLDHRQAMAINIIGRVKMVRSTSGL